MLDADNHDDPRLDDCPSSWFVSLETALRHGACDVEADALRHLRRLGVLVEIDPVVAAQKWMRRSDPITNRPKPKRRRSRAS